MKERSSETVFVVSDGLLAQTLRTACVRSAHILLVEFKFHMGYSLLGFFGELIFFFYTGNRHLAVHGIDTATK